MRIVRVIVLALLAVLVLAVALYFGLDAWIESAGGKRAVEKQLSAAAGLPVRLAGDFDVVFLPMPGVSGTDLRVADPVSGEDVAGSKRYALDLALKPLFKKQFVADRLELDWLTLGAPGGQRFSIPAVAVSGFEVNAPTGIAVDLGWLGAVDGQFTWSPAQSAVDLALEWRQQGRDAIEAGGRVRYFNDGALFDGLRVVIGGQELVGVGCFRAAGKPALDLDLEAAVLDLDALEAALPAGQGTAGALPLEINFRLRADELQRGGLRARGTVLEVGSAPACHPAGDRGMPSVD